MADFGDYARNYLTMADQQGQNTQKAIEMFSTLQGTPIQKQELGLRKEDLLLRRQQSAEEQQRRNAQQAETERHNKASESNYRAATGNRLSNLLAAKGLSLSQDENGQPVIAPIEGANSNKPVPLPAQNSLSSASSMLQNLVTLRNDFKDYGGFVVPGVGEAWQMAQYFPMLPTENRDWWKNYEDLYQATKRHSLYGSAISGRESGFSKQAQINPAMQNDSIKDYLDARIGMMLIDLGKNTKQLSQSFNPKQVHAAAGEDFAGKYEKENPRFIKDFARIGKEYREIGQPMSPEERQARIDLLRKAHQDGF